MTQPSDDYSLNLLVSILKKLRDPVNGCPWDLQQTPDTLKTYLLEEVYELIAAMSAGEAIEEPDSGAIKDELGDCFFLLCFIASYYQDQGLFRLNEALSGAADKMVRRHPHIFGGKDTPRDADEVRARWHELKKQEKAAGKDSTGSYLSRVPRNLPALLLAHRLSERAGRTGFDWPGWAEVLESLDREMVELKDALAGGSHDRVTAELGDVLFTLTNLARHLRINAEEALQKTNRRFQHRFRYIEEALTAQGKNLEDATLKEMDCLWEEAKSRGL